MDEEVKEQVVVLDTQAFLKPSKQCGTQALVIDTNAISGAL